MKNMEDNWHAATAKQVGRAVADLRRKLGLTAQDLAERCRELGAPIHRTTITKIENGRPRFDLGELIILAAALNTAPIALLYPGPDYGESVEVLPGVEDRKIDAVQWFSGIRDHGYTDTASSPEGAGAAGRDSARRRREYRENMRELQLWRELFEVQRKIGSLVVSASWTDDGERAVGKLSEAQLTLLEDWQEREHELRDTLGLGEPDNGG